MVASRPLYTLSDYERVEADSGIRHELVDGLILAMAGGTLEHARLAAAVVSELRGALSRAGRSCMALGSDMRVGHETREFRAYPDASVLCGEPRYAGRPPHTLLNPTLVVEVLSESTAAYDQGEKLAQYQAMPSVAGIIFVSQEGREMRVHRRGQDGFHLEAYGPGETFECPGLDVTLTVDAIYE